MDISETLAPDSDQLDAIELISGPRTFAIERVSRGNAEQPVNIHLIDFPRPWRPGKSMRRVLAAAWGTDASVYAGRRVTLYYDPEVTFGKEKCGGTRISHLSHIDKPQKVSLLVSRGKSKVYTVQPLTEAAPTPKADDHLARMFAAFKAAGVTDKDAMLTACTEATGREVTSSKDLTAAEADQVIDALKSDAADMAATEAGGE